MVIQNSGLMVFGNIHESTEDVGLMKPFKNVYPGFLWNFKSLWKRG